MKACVPASNKFFSLIKMSFNYYWLKLGGDRLVSVIVLSPKDN